MLQNRVLAAGLAVAAVSALTACGGSSGNSELAAEYGDLQDHLEELRNDLDPTAPDDVPTAGTATYHGLAGGDFIVDGEEVGGARGALTMTVEFGASDDNAVSGTISNFLAEDDETIGGSLALSEGTISDAGITFRALGNLDTPGYGTLYADLGLDGEFYGGGSGSNPEAIFGNLDGTLYTGGSGGPEAGEFDGSFGAELAP